MTQEEKAKRYDEAIEELRGLLEGIREEKCKILEEDITSIFPELKESEDERIRKELIENFKCFCGDYPETTKWGKDDNLLVKDIIAWLEKQGEKKSIEWSGKIGVKHADGKLKEMLDRKEHHAWSEEDEEILRTIISDGIRGAEFDMLQIDWLKSLKDRYAWKPSDEQMAVLNEVINYAANSELRHWSNFIYTLLKSLREQLKKLK